MKRKKNQNEAVAYEAIEIIPVLQMEKYRICSMPTGTAQICPACKKSIYATPTYAILTVVTSKGHKTIRIKIGDDRAEQVIKF